MRLAAAMDVSLTGICSQIEQAMAQKNLNNVDGV
jgi:hypothetical protein